MVQLSNDHKPEIQSEKTRILKAGGKVHPMHDFHGKNVGPPRVWLKNIQAPGLAMSRSFGDSLAHTVGVSNEPEILKFDLEND